MDGQAELAWVAGFTARGFTYPKAVIHSTANRTEHPPLIRTGIDRLSSDFLLVIRSNHGPISYRFPDKFNGDFGQNCIFPTPRI